MLSLLMTFGAEDSSGIGALGINGQALLIQLVTFVIAYIVLRRYAFQPILKVLRQRRELIESGVKLGEDMQKERAELDKKVSAELRGARQKADGIVAEAHDAARDTQREAEEKARLKAEAITADAHARGQLDAAKLRKEVEKDVLSLVADATETIIGEKVDSRKDAALIDKALQGRPPKMPSAKVSRGSLSLLLGRRSLDDKSQKQLAEEIAAYLLDTGRTSELDSILRDITNYRAWNQVVEVTVVTTHPLDATSQADVRSKVKTFYPQAGTIIINNRLDPSMLAGVKLELPGQQLDLTARAQLNKLKQLTGKER